MKRKGILALILGIVLLLSFAACGTRSQQTGPDSQGVSEQSESNTGGKASESIPSQTQEPITETQGPNSSDKASEDNVPNVPGTDILVVVFSATGTTKGVAEKIAAITGADFYEILPAEPYSSDDLNYNDRNSRSTKEQNDKSARPAIGSDAIDLSGYSTIYIGFPIWWGEGPRIMDTFVESDSFDGITLIPFCTSGSSGIGRSGPNMEALAGSGTWLDGKRFPGSVSESELQSWIEGLK